MEYTAKDLIEKLGMVPHFEGGWYAVRGHFGVEIPPAGLPPEYSVPHHSASRIYYMLQEGEESAWHILKSAEVWLWHAGGSTETLLGGSGAQPQVETRLRLGPRIDAGEDFCLEIPARTWQTTRLLCGPYALVSCIVSPAFHIEDFSLA